MDNQYISDQDYKNAQNDPVDNGLGIALPILIYNDEGKIWLDTRRDTPVWRTFGTVYQPTDQEPSIKGAFHDAAVEILKQQTNLTDELCENVREVMEYRVRQNGVGTEQNHIFSVNIGNYPFETRRGVFAEAFDPNHLPRNMFTNMATIIEKNQALIEAGEKRILKTSIDAPPPTLKPQAGDWNEGRMWQPLDIIENAEDIYRLADWNSHPTIIAKREAGKLIRDPFPTYGVR